MDLQVSPRLSSVIDPALEAFSYTDPALPHWTAWEDDRLRTAAESLQVDQGLKWELVATSVGTGKVAAECEARWREMGGGGAGEGNELMSEDVVHGDDIPVDSSASTSRQPSQHGSPSAFDLPVSRQATARLPPGGVPDLPTLLAAASTASQRLHILHTTASPSVTIGQPLLQDEQLAEEVSKRHWSVEEDRQLLALVDTHGPRNWLRLAQTLATGRTGPSCCARWCRLAQAEKPDDAASSSKPKPRRPRRDRSEMPAGTKTAYAAIAKGKRQRWAKWTSTEDAHLVALIQEHGLNEWDKIGHAMPHDDETKEKRTGDSCQARWNHYLCKKEEYRVWSEGMLERAWVEGKGAELDEEERRKEIEKKKAEMEKTRARASANAASSRWSSIEDERLLSLREKHPTKGWKWIGDQLEPKRSAGSCRARWSQQLCRDGEVVVSKSKRTSASATPAGSERSPAPVASSSPSSAPAPLDPIDPSLSSSIAFVPPPPAASTFHDVEEEQASERGELQALLNVLQVDPIAETVVGDASGAGEGGVATAAGEGVEAEGSLKRATESEETNTSVRRSKRARKSRVLE